MQQTENEKYNIPGTLFINSKISPASHIERLPGQGSDRIYYRFTSGNNSFIATHGNNLKENETFIYFTKVFSKLGLPVPKILGSTDEKYWYVQEDLGNISLLNVVEEKGCTPEVYEFYVKSLQALAAMQVQGDKQLDYDKTLTSREFGKEAILSDLLYFKYYFLDTLQYPYDKQKLLQDFEAMSIHLSEAQYSYFMFRDFQSRNIMIKENTSVHFIDYQGGMKGAPQYDAASLLWQAKANLPADWKEKLWKEYTMAFEKETGEQIDQLSFTQRYIGYVLLRLLQVLGAYGFRGLFERKSHFLSSIPLGLNNLKSFLILNPLFADLTELNAVLAFCTSDKIIEKFSVKKATPETPLLITINSFSYPQNGYPPDPTKNGGGFVFDCRGILNPGRINEYKTQSGEDIPVKEYLETQTKMPQFLHNVFSIVDISVEDYLNRDFESLMVNFGCTGGQHRSVFAANALARHLRNKFNVRVNVNHLNKEGWKKLKN